MILTVPRFSIVFLILSVGAIPTLAEEPPKPTKPGPPKPKVDLGLPNFDALPKADGLKKRDDNVTREATGSLANSYRVVRVQHARGFARTATGSVPIGGELQAITLSGRPLLTEKFTTVVRVKSSAKLAAPIDVSILDSFGDTVFSASGQLSYRGVKTDEVDYVVDWDRTPVRAPGNYQVQIRVAGDLIGSYPLTAVEAKN